MTRLGNNKSRRETAISKKQASICKYLEQGNEANAKILCATLINEEGMVPVYDEIAGLCEELNGRLAEMNAKDR